MAATGDASNSDEEARDRAELYGCFAKSIEDHEFPLVRPVELNDACGTGVAEETLLSLEKVEAVELQSFHDATWEEYREANPADGDMTEEHRRARFAHDTHYLF